MKLINKFTLITFLFFTFSCNAQTVMVKSPNEAVKLQENEKQFEGKPLKSLLEQIKPDVKFIYGTPERTSSTAIKLFFVPKDKYTTATGRKSVGILVSLLPDAKIKRKPIPVGGMNTSTKEVIQYYGDMIIRSVYVTGKD